MQFTPEQQVALDSLTENVQIIACAGSGKTQVISQRIIRLLSSGLAEPSQVIAFTYTEKAAAELKARVLKLARDQLGSQKGLADMYIGTIHGWCLNILQDTCLEYQKFSVLDEIKLTLFVNKTFKDNGMADLEMERYKETKFFIALMGLLREAELGKPLTAPLQEALEKYETTLRNHAWFDFTMIMSEVKRRIQSDAAFRTKLAAQHRFLIVDEYQDVNPVQESIIRSLFELGLRICVVGDDDQTIYQWRGGDVRYILDFAARYSRPGKPVKSIKLEDNFRSSQAVVDTGRQVIQNNTQRLGKTMRASGHQGYEFGDLLAHDFPDQASEARWIAATVGHLRGLPFQDKKDGEARGLDYSDMVVLLRKWKKAEALVEAFKEAGIPFVVTGVNHLFEQTEAQAARGLYQFLADQMDADLLHALWQEVLPSLDPARWQTALQHLEEKKPSRVTYYHDLNLQALFWKFLELAGITESALLNVEAPGQLENSYGELVLYNLGMFSQIIQDFETIHFTDSPSYKLQGFLNFLSYTGEGSYPEGWLSNTYKTPNAVQIMTVHQSKGLEFPAVFLPGLNKNYFPAQRQGGKKVWHFIDKDFIEGVERYEGTLEDERRLMYVAITRAKKYLFLSSAPAESRNDRVPSLFLVEAKRAGYLVSSPERNWADRPRLSPQREAAKQILELNFSLMKSLFDCPWKFKLYNLYGFLEPLNQRIGYGRTLHNVLMELHRQALEGTVLDVEALDGLLTRHEHFPYALGKIRKAMHDKARQYLAEYIRANRQDFETILFAEKEIQIDLGDGVLINGRVDLIKKRVQGQGELTYLIDYKSKDDVQTRSLTMQQLYLYALGYESLTGQRAQVLQIFDLERNAPENEEVTPTGLERSRRDIDEAVFKIRTLDLNHACGDPECACRLKG